MHVRVLVDRSTTEVFVGSADKPGQVSFVASYSPALDATGVALVSATDLAIESAGAWSMGCGWNGTGHPVGPL